MSQTLTPHKEFWAELQGGLEAFLPKPEYFYLLLVDVYIYRLLLLLLVTTAVAVLTLETFYCLRKMAT